MKAETHDRHVEHVDRVVRYLAENLDASPSLQDLANVAGVSRFHFLRLYRAMTGETPLGTLRRLRMARAAALLDETRDSVTQIALDVGFESSQAFSKAFRQATGLSATTLRQTPELFESVIDSLAGPPEQGEGVVLEVRLVTVTPFTVIATRHLGPHSRLRESFGRLFRYAHDKGWGDALGGIYGIPIDDPRDVVPESCRFDCCFGFGPEAAADAEFRKLSLGGGLFAVARHVGPYEGLLGKYDSLYGAWLDATGHVVRDSPCFNHYLADPDTVPSEKWQTDLYLPVERTESKGAIH